MPVVKQGGTRSSSTPGARAEVPDPKSHLSPLFFTASQRAVGGEAPLYLEALTLLVLHGQPVLRGEVHRLAGGQAELQLLQQGGEEEEDLPAADGLADAAPPPQAKRQHFVALRPVDLGPGCVEEPLGLEGGGVLPELPAAERRDLSKLLGTAGKESPLCAECCNVVSFRHPEMLAACCGPCSPPKMPAACQPLSAQPIEASTSAPDCVCLHRYQGWLKSARNI